MGERYLPKCSQSEINIFSKGWHENIPELLCNTLILKSSDLCYQEAFWIEVKTYLTFASLDKLPNAVLISSIQEWHLHFYIYMYSLRVKNLTGDLLLLHSLEITRQRIKINHHYLMQSLRKFCTCIFNWHGFCTTLWNYLPHM